MDGCYLVRRFAGAHPEAPLLKEGAGSQIRSYVITMQGCERDLKQLQLVTPDTYLLENAGFKRCPKEGVTNSFQDLLHANRHICQLEAHNPDPVFIFEDDAELLSLSPTDFREAIAVARTPGVDAVALGCNPFVSWRSRDLAADGHVLDWHRVDVGATTHAFLLSHRGRQKLMSLRVPPWLPHDVMLYRRLKVFTPRHPLAGQLHPRTENSRAWDKTGLVKSLLFDRSQCHISANKCYSDFHNRLSIGASIKPMAFAVGVISAVAMPLIAGGRAARWSWSASG